MAKRKGYDDNMENLQHRMSKLLDKMSAIWTLNIFHPKCKDVWSSTYVGCAWPSYLPPIYIHHFWGERKWTW